MRNRHAEQVRSNGRCRPKTLTMGHTPQKTQIVPQSLIPLAMAPSKRLP